MLVGHLYIFFPLSLMAIPNKRSYKNVLNKDSRVRISEVRYKRTDFRQKIITWFCKLQCDCLKTNLIILCVLDLLLYYTQLLLYWLKYEV